MVALIGALLCVGANAFFVAAEFALAKVRPTALQAMARSGDAAASRAYGITRRLDAYLSATQLGITLASLGLGWLGEGALHGLLEPLFTLADVPDHVAHGASLTLAFGTISFLHIVIGELVPKSLAIARPEAVSRWSATPLQVFYWVSFPALWLLNNCSNLVLKACGLPAPSHAEGKLSEEELNLLIQVAMKGEQGTQTKRELLERVMRATDRPVRAFMVPRVDLKMLSISDRIETCMQEVQRHGYSRYPVAEDGDPDRIVGYVYVKDLLMARDRPRGSVGRLKRDILYVPESRTVGELLGELKATKIPIAIVVDEYGGTSGLVTLDDVVAEIMGDIQDELHLNEPRINVLKDGSVLADGSLPMDELELDGLDAPTVEGAETVGGYVLLSLGRLAHPGDRIRVGTWEMVVDDVRARRVHRVAIRPFRSDTSSVPPPPSAST